MICDPRIDHSYLLPLFSTQNYEWLTNTLNHKVVDLVFDLGKKPEIRYLDGGYTAGNHVITLDDIEQISDQLRFSKNKRAILNNTLTRISKIENANGMIVGYTFRFASLLDFSFLIKDLLIMPKSILIIGAPGKGKTSLLRSLSITNANQVGRRTVIVDKSNEIAGENDILPDDFGRCRRLQVQNGNQYATLIEAVENHTPETIVVDELSDTQDCLAVKSITERGVKVIATAHGESLSSILKNPMLSKVFGGIKSATLGDDEMNKRELDSKNIIEREFPASFDMIIELVSPVQIAIYHNAEITIDKYLAGEEVEPEYRCYDLANRNFTVTQLEKI